MLTRREYKDLTWIDLESPTESELKQVADEYQIHSLVVGELTQPSLRSKVDLYSDFIYLILHFPICQICYGERKEGNLDTEEIDFVIGREFLITTHYQPIAGITEFAAVFQPGQLESRGQDKTPASPSGRHAGLLFYHLVRQLYGELTTGLDYINGVLKQAEKKIFADQELAMVKLLTEVNRNLLDFRWALKHHREVLNSLTSVAREFFDDSFRYHLGVVIGEYDRIWTMLESNRETFTDLRETNESLLSIKTNETMKVFTVVAVIFFPLTLITQFFGMNIILPIADSPYSYYFVLALMLGTLFVMLALAKYRRWL
ncbi:MAG: magnesium transporter CorA family protein [Candidatus Vogelbacteria bacterium]